MTAAEKTKAIAPRFYNLPEFGVVARLGPFGAQHRNLATVEAISQVRLPADMKDRDRFVGVRVIRSGANGEVHPFNLFISR